MDKQPMVSVCCEVFNQEDYIRDMLESMVNQHTEFTYEVIVHDDASTDSTVSIIEEYRKKYPHIIKPIYQKKNQYSQGKKILPSLMREAKGKYIGICEGDDYWTDCNKLQRQVDFLEGHPEYSLCVHAANVIEADTKRIIEVNSPHSQDTDLSVEELILGGGGYLETNTMVFRTDLVKQLPDYYYHCMIEDYPLTLYLALSGKVRYLNFNMSVYRRMSKNSWSSKMADRKQPRLQFYNRCTKLQDSLVTLLTQIDQLTNQVYHTAIEQRMNKNAFNYYKMVDDSRNLRKEFKKEYKKLQLGFRIKMNLKYLYYFILNGR